MSQALLSQALFAVGQELKAKHDHGAIAAGTWLRVERVIEPRPGEFEYRVEFDRGRTALLTETTLHVLTR